MHQPRSIFLPLFLAALVGACGDDPTGTEDDQRTIKANPSFANDIVEITNRRGCTAASCHGGGAGGMTLGDAATTYAAWVNVPAVCGGSGCTPQEIRVIPGDAQNSYLVKKLEGRPGIVGVQMPFGMDPLDNTDLTNIRNWIDQGALEN